MPRERLDEIEAREKAAAAAGDEAQLAVDNCDEAWSAEAHERWSSALAKSGADVPWLVAQVREREAEVARLANELARMRAPSTGKKAPTYKQLKCLCGAFGHERCRRPMTVGDTAFCCCVTDKEAPDDGFAANLAELRAMRDGWLDGKGLAPDSETLDWLAKTLPAWIAGGMLRPRLYATEDGYVRAEWPVGDDGVDASAEFHACVVRVQK